LVFERRKKMNPLETIKRIWMQELNSPEILMAEEDVVDDLMGKITAQVEDDSARIESFRKKCCQRWRRRINSS
jgi:NifB/MoaA-like Fe-S oxidoreductase